MLCRQCGSEIGRGGEFCGTCGAGQFASVCRLPRVPKPLGYCSDFARVLDVESVTAIGKASEALERLQKIQCVSVIVVTTEPLFPKDYAFRLLNEWGVGGWRCRGVLVLIAIEERRIEMEVGHGLEQKLSGARGRIALEHFCVPFLRQGRYAEALLSIIQELPQLTRESAAGHGFIRNEAAL